MPDKPSTSPLNAVREFFSMTASEFARNWRDLTALDKEQLKASIMDGTFTY